jgi:hypothetical protein
MGIDDGGELFGTNPSGKGEGERKKDPKSVRLD